MTEPSNVTELVQLEKAGEKLKFLFFWGHRPRADGSAGEGCLSQWWPAPFSADGRTYATAEHYMMAAKARLFEDHATEAKILGAQTPAEAKALGRQVIAFDQARWEYAREELVTDGNIAKFSQHPELAAYLLSTGGRILVEASPTDRIWGIGLAATDPKANRPSEWQGLNLLGFSLMKVRRHLRTTV